MLYTCLLGPGLLCNVSNLLGRFLTTYVMIYTCWVGAGLPLAMLCIAGWALDYLCDTIYLLG
jgi:hypothetical protein